ncbi:MAG: hypothetical protein ACKO5Q_08875 [Microcystaceae cyanobacterium]
MPAFEEIPIGTRVEIIQPDDVAGCWGIILGREEIEEGEWTDRWLIQVGAEEMILSLAQDEFRVIQQP